MAVKRKRISNVDGHPSTTSRFFSACQNDNNSAEKENDPITISDDERECDPVTQEDGYLSPSPSVSRAVTPELSSPVLSRTLSMPYRKASPTQDIRTQDVIVLVRGSSEPAPEREERGVLGPDLSINLCNDSDEEELGDATDEISSDIQCWDDEGDDPVVGREDNDTESPPSSNEPTQQ